MLLALCNIIRPTCVLCFLSWCQRWWGACQVSYLLVIRRKCVLFTSVFYLRMYQDKIMRYEPSWFCKLVFYGSQNIDWKEIYSVQVYGGLLSNAAPCCMSHATKLTADGDAKLHSSPLGQLNMEGATAGDHGLWLGFKVQRDVGKKAQKTWRCDSKKWAAQNHTCNIKLNLHRDFIGQSGVSEQLMGFLQSTIFSWDPINGQQSVPHLQQPTPPCRNYYIYFHVSTLKTLHNYFEDALSFSHT